MFGLLFPCSCCSYWSRSSYWCYRNHWNRRSNGRRGCSGHRSRAWAGKGFFPHCSRNCWSCKARWNRWSGSTWLFVKVRTDWSARCTSQWVILAVIYEGIDIQGCFLFGTQLSVVYTSLLALSSSSCKDKCQSEKGVNTIVAR